MEVKHAGPLRRRSLYPVIKRGMDILVSALALLLLLPLFLLIALAVFLDDPLGSPLYISTRCGRNGKPFALYKFRTMTVGADVRRDGLWPLNEMDGPVFKMKNDPRITRVGHLLRRMSLDELPQLFNVLKGEMSLVGPRPPLPCEVSCYDARACQRLSIVPGLTCIWQVTPHRNEVSFADWLEMDLRYIREQSPLLDVKLLLCTFLVMARGEGQ